MPVGTCWWKEGKFGMLNSLKWSQTLVRGQLNVKSLRMEFKRIFIWKNDKNLNLYRITNAMMKSLHLHVWKRKPNKIFWFCLTFTGIFKFEIDWMALNYAMQAHRAVRFVKAGLWKFSLKNIWIEIVGKLWIKNCRNCVEVTRQSANRVPASRASPARETILCWPFRLPSLFF